MQQRNISLDALRGFAILTMILSGSVAFGDVLPAWMYHAQVPPPNHQFIPTLPGITWVDLVFPFFLFAMGTAIPLSLHKKITEGISFWQVLLIATKRMLLLVFFALFTQHMKAWVMQEHPTTVDYLLSIGSFVLLFFQLVEIKGLSNSIIFKILKWLSFLIALLCLYFLPMNKGNGFDFYKSDIIIMVLANMAFFGTILYFLTAKNVLYRIGLLPFIMAIFLTAKEPSASWTKEVFNFNSIGEFKFDWMYTFYFLKYLFIVLPATVAGEWMMADAKLKKEKIANANGLALVSIGLIVVNLIGLFTRNLTINLVATVALCWLAIVLVQQHTALKKWVHAASYLLLLGLFFEAYEGGIKKDSSTYSYYFVTTGLAFFLLVAFTVLQETKGFKSIIQYLANNGKNPMVAYVAGSLVLIPLLNITHANTLLEALNQNAWLGFLKGIIFTGIVSLITLWFTKQKWFWKT